MALPGFMWRSIHHGEHEGHERIRSHHEDHEGHEGFGYFLILNFVSFVVSESARHTETAWAGLLARKPEDPII